MLGRINAVIEQIYTLFCSITLFNLDS